MTRETMDVSDVSDFDAAWRQVDDRIRMLIRVIYGLIGLSRLGEHPVTVDRFASYLDQPTEQAVALLEENSGALFTTRVDDGMITLNLDRPEALRRRWLRIGDRWIAMSGCAPDLFQIAAVLDTPFHVEDTCPATGVPIRVDFAPPDRDESPVTTVDPAGTVVALDAGPLGQTVTMTPEQIDTNLCVRMPFYASTDAAREWLAGNPARRVCPVRRVHRLEVVGFVRDVVRPRLAAAR